MALDRRRADAAGQELEPVPTPASTTAAGLARRFTAEAFTGIEAAITAVNARALGLVGQVRRTAVSRRVTLDIDATDVEVYGRAKTGSAYNYQGQRTYRADIVLWAELGIPVAADLLAGDDARKLVALIRRTTQRPPLLQPAAAPAGCHEGGVADTPLLRRRRRDRCARPDIEFATGVKRNPRSGVPPACRPRLRARSWNDTGIETGSRTEVAVIPTHPRAGLKLDHLPGPTHSILADQISTILMPGSGAPSRRTSWLWPWTQVDHAWWLLVHLTNRPVHF